MKPHAIKHVREDDGQLFRIVRISSETAVVEKELDAEPWWEEAKQHESIRVLRKAFLDLYDFTEKFKHELSDLADDNLRPPPKKRKQ